MRSATLGRSASSRTAQPLAPDTEAPAPRAHLARRRRRAHRLRRRRRDASASAPPISKPSRSQRSRIYRYHLFGFNLSRRSRRRRARAPRLQRLALVVGVHLQRLADCSHECRAIASAVPLQSPSSSTSFAARFRGLVWWKQEPQRSKVLQKAVHVLWPVCSDISSCMPAKAGRLTEH